MHGQSNLECKFNEFADEWGGEGGRRGGLKSSLIEITPFVLNATFNKAIEFSAIPVRQHFPVRQSLLGGTSIVTSIIHSLTSRTSNIYNIFIENLRFSSFNITFNYNYTISTNIFSDGMTDCSDSECCSHPICAEHIMCLASNDPVEVLLRKQPPSVTASFYQRVKFLIEENSVQSYAHMDEYSER